MAFSDAGRSARCQAWPSRLCTTLPFWRTAMTPRSPPTMLRPKNGTPSPSDARQLGLSICVQLLPSEEDHSRRRDVEAFRRARGIGLAGHATLVADREQPVPEAHDVCKGPALGQLGLVGDRPVLPVRRAEDGALARDRWSRTSRQRRCSRHSTAACPRSRTCSARTARRRPTSPAPSRRGPGSAARSPSARRLAPGSRSAARRARANPGSGSGSDRRSRAA